MKQIIYVISKPTNQPNNKITMNENDLHTIFNILFLNYSIFPILSVEINERAEHILPENKNANYYVINK